MFVTRFTAAALLVTANLGSTRANDAERELPALHQRRRLAPLGFLGNLAKRGVEYLGGKALTGALSYAGACGNQAITSVQEQFQGITSMGKCFQESSVSGDAYIHERVSQHPGDRSPLAKAKPDPKGTSHQTSDSLALEEEKDASPQDGKDLKQRSSSQSSNESDMSIGSKKSQPASDSPVASPSGGERTKRLKRDRFRMKLRYETLNRRFAKSVCSVTCNDPVNKARYTEVEVDLKTQLNEALHPLNKAMSIKTYIVKDREQNRNIMLKLVNEALGKLKFLSIPDPDKNVVQFPPAVLNHNPLAMDVPVTKDEFRKKASRIHQHLKEVQDLLWSVCFTDLSDIHEQVCDLHVNLKVLIARTPSEATAKWKILTKRI